jgi:hypothetical protein
MSTGTGSEDELIRRSHEERLSGEGVRASSLDEDRATRFTRGVVDGFTEASQAFSRELEGTNRFPELMGRSVAGVIRANARLLDEVATMVRQAADGWGERPRRPADGVDYERLADMVAARLAATTSAAGATSPADATRGRRKA